MIHNGIIENYGQLKQELLNKGYTFTSDTDTEVLLNFIEEIKKNNKCSLEEAISMLPLILKRLGADPAASSTPFVATLVDVTGLIIYFSVAILVLSGKLL
jgi:glutamate synthase domain-containing protein 1